MKIVRGLKAAAKAFVAAPNGQSFRAGGKLVECPHCETILFRKAKVPLNPAMDAVLQGEGGEACVLVCANCSRMQWFLADLKTEQP